MRHKEKAIKEIVNQLKDNDDKAPTKAIVAMLNKKYPKYFNTRYITSVLPRYCTFKDNQWIPR